MTARVDDEPVDGPSAAGHGVGPGPEAAAPVIIGSGPGTVRGTAERPRGPITVEQAYRAKLEAAGAPQSEPVAVADPDPPATSPAAVGPPPVRNVAARRPAGPGPLPHLRARPRIEPEQGILGLSRRTRSRLGSRLFNLFFVCVFALIVVQMVVALLTP